MSNEYFIFYSPPTSGSHSPQCPPPSLTKDSQGREREKLKGGGASAWSRERKVYRSKPPLFLILATHPTLAVIPSRLVGPITMATHADEIAPAAPVTGLDEKPSAGLESESLEKQSLEHDGGDEAARNKKQNGGLGPVSLIFACGAALFSDGYVNANSGPTNTLIKRIYGGAPYNLSTAELDHFSSLYSSLAFAGTLLGMLVFGVLSDRIGRRAGMLFASVWLSLFSVLISGSWGAGGSVSGLFTALQAYRFLIGIAIGAEYPAGSVACSENTEGAGVNPKRQQMYFVLATNTMIDIGFVAATLVAFILFNIFGERHLEWVWRLTLGLGAIPPLTVLYFRVKMQETEHYRKGAIRRRMPWWLIVKKYWSRLTAVSIAWFIYDYISVRDHWQRGKKGCRLTLLNSPRHTHTHILSAVPRLDLLELLCQPDCARRQSVPVSRLECAHQCVLHPRHLCRCLCL